MKFDLSTKAAVRGGAPTGRGTALFRPEAAQRANRPYKDGWSIQRSIDAALVRSVWVYRGVTAIAQNQAKLPFVERKGDWFMGDIVKNSKIAATLNGNVTGVPTINTTIFRRMMSMQYLLNTQGAMVEVVRTKTGDLSSLNLLPPNYTSPVPDPDTFIKEWVIEYPGTPRRTLKRDDVIWVREPHPTDYYSGMTPLQAAGLSIEMDWYARLWNRNFILNDGRPAALLAVKGQVDDDVAQDMIRRLGGGSGPNSAGKMVVIETEEGAELIEFGSSPRDAQYVEMRKIVKDETLQALGVPESVAGNASQRTFANADAELEVFWRETMLPHCEGISRSFDTLTPQEDRFISFDFSRVPILDRDLREKRNFYLQEYQAGARSTNEYRAKAEDLPPAHGNVDRMYRGVGLQEVGDVKDTDWQDPALAQGMGGEGGFGGELPPGEGPPPEGEVDEFGNPLSPEFGQGFGGGQAPPEAWQAESEPWMQPPADDSWLTQILDRSKELGVADQIEVTSNGDAHDDIVIAAYPADGAEIRMVQLGKTHAAMAPPLPNVLAAVYAWALVTPPIELKAGGLGDARQTLTGVLDAAGIEWETDIPTFASRTGAARNVKVTYGDTWVEVPLRGSKAAQEDPVEAWLAFHAAWQGTMAEVLGNHFDREQRVVLEKLTGRKSRQRYEQIIRPTVTAGEPDV